MHDSGRSLRAAARRHGSATAWLVAVVLVAGLGHTSSGAEARPAPSASAARSGWVAQPLGSLKRSETTFSALSCTEPVRCTAIGYVRLDNQPVFPLATSWSGRRARTWVGNRPGEVKLFSGVACPTASTCIAVGSDANYARRRVVPLAMRKVGARWVRQSVPNASGLRFGRLVGVSCSTAADCVAVGRSCSDIICFGTVAPLVVSWDGSRWTIDPVPSPPGATFSGLLGVSCAAPTACFAVGQTESSTGAVVPLVELWDGTQRTMQSAPAPDVAARLIAISCSAPTACLAVGGARSERHRSSSSFLAEQWDGSSWRIVPTPRNVLSPDGLVAVSCVSASACLAAGNGLLTWDGSHLRAISRPAGSRVSAVSCTPSGCAVVGSRGTHKAAAAWHQARLPQASATSAAQTAFNLTGHIDR